MSSGFDATFRTLDDYITARMAAARTPGMAVALFDRERRIRIATYGFADPEARVPLAPDTLFGIGSVTKSFTGLAVAQAAVRGLLDLHRPVTDYLPWFYVQTRFAPITLHHLLTHTAGLVGVVDRSPDIRGAVWALRETEAAWPPGSRFHYSDAGYQVLTLVLEAVMGHPFADVIRTQIFEPLGMVSSVAAMTHAVRPRLARGYCPLYDDRPPHPSHPLVPVPWVESSSGDCSIASTAEDMARYGRMLLNRGRGETGPLLSNTGFDLITHPHVVSSTISALHPSSYGYGLAIRQRDGFAHLEHGGRYPGFIAHLIADMDNGTGVMTLSTTPHATGSQWAAMRLWRAAHLGLPLEPDALGPADQRPEENAAGRTDVGAQPSGPPSEPPEWHAYPGHYRAHMPWEATNFRVVLRDGELRLAWPQGNEVPLVPRGERPGEFWIGADPTPEWVRFDQIANGHALRATLSATDYYRFFTP